MDRPDDALVEEMMALVREVAKVRHNRSKHPGAWFALDTEIGDKAYVLAARLPRPVDPDWTEAKSIVALRWPTAAPENEHALHQAAYSGLKRGKELANQ